MFHNAYASKTSIERLCVGNLWVCLGSIHDQVFQLENTRVQQVAYLLHSFLHILCHFLRNKYQSSDILFKNLSSWNLEDQDGSPPITLPYSSLFHSSTTSGVDSWRQLFRPSALLRLGRTCMILHSPVKISLSPRYGNACVNMDKFFEEKNLMIARNWSAQSIMHMSLGLHNAAQKLI